MKGMEWVPHKLCTVGITIHPSYAGNVTLGIMTTKAHANYYYYYYYYYYFYKPNY